MCTAPQNLPARREPAAVRRVGVRLEKREQRLLPETGSEVRKNGAGKKKSDGVQALLLSRTDERRPPGTVEGKGLLPAIKGRRCDPEGLAQFLDSHGAGKVQFQDMEDKGERVLLIWDNEIREQDMGMPAGTADPDNFKDAAAGSALLDIYYAACVGRKNPAFSPYPA